MTDPLFTETIDAATGQPKIEVKSVTALPVAKPKTVKVVNPSSQAGIILRHLQMADGQPLTKRHLEGVSGSERIAARVNDLIAAGHHIEGVKMRDVQTRKPVYAYRLPVAFERAA